MGEVIEAKSYSAGRYWAAASAMTMPAKVLDAALGESRADLLSGAAGRPHPGLGCVEIRVPRSV